jgi:hypothetical protein
MKKIILALAVATVAVMAVVGSASADVARYQVASGLTVTAKFNGVTYVHTYTLTNNPCDGTGSFTGTGGIDSLGLFHENIAGTLTGRNIKISGVYPDSYLPDPGYTWSYEGPLSGGGTYADSHGNQVAVSLAVSTTNYKNHGDYVSSQGGGDDAAHSCIGMPIH